MPQRSGINRGLIWLKKVLQITEETEAPSTLSELVTPSMDVFGWSRLLGQDGTQRQTENNQSSLASDIVLLTAVPQDVARFVIYASCGTDDPAAPDLSMQVRTSGVDVAIEHAAQGLNIEPARWGLTRNILLVPGEQLLCRSSPAPAAGQRIFVRMTFVDLEPGEYLPAL